MSRLRGRNTGMNVTPAVIKVLRGKTGTRVISCPRKHVVRFLNSILETLDHNAITAISISVETEQSS